MASITSLSNSSYNTSSIYGNRNILSGLASGMDTESMIENAVSGIKLKIQNLVKKRTKVEWQQEAYRSIIDKAVNFNTKYTSYSSKTNLLSASFFNNAVNTTVNGTWKDKLTASGRTSSDIQINAVKQMAKAATYTVSGLNGAGDVSSVTGDAFDITSNLDVSTMSGTLTFQYGGTNGASFDIKFDELEDIGKMDGSTNAEKMANAINKKLSEISYSYTKNGVQETTTADKAVKVTANADGRLTFTDGLGNGNTVKISGSSGKIKGYASENSLKVDNQLTEPVRRSDYLGGEKGTDGKWSGGKDLGITFNGTSKKISMSDVMNRAEELLKETPDATDDEKNEAFKDALQAELDDAFGKGKITASYKGGKLSLETEKNGGDTLSLGGSAVEALGFKSGDSNFVNPSMKLTDILGEKNDFFMKNRLEAVGEVNTDKMTDSAGNRVKLGDDGKYYRVNSDNKFLYDFKVNGASIAVNEDTTLESLMNSINSSAEAGMKVSYSKLTNEFQFTASEMGANGKIEFEGLAKDLFVNHANTAKSTFEDVYGFNPGEKDRFQIEGESNIYSFNFDSDSTTTIQDVVDALNTSFKRDNKEMTASFDELSGRIMVNDDKTGKTMELKMTDEAGKEHKVAGGSSYTTGQDAVMDVTINGKNFANLTRSSNSVDIDGLTINLKGEFNVDGKNTVKEGETYEPITFTTATDSDKIVETIRQFVDDYNEMATEIKNAYSTMPGQQSNGSRYEPLTAEEEEKYSESELKAYNEKAKQGILFGDTTLSSMYSKLLNAIQPGGTDGQTLREIGIGTSYSNGMTTLSLDENKLRTALESDPDKVKNAFTKTREGGSASDGLMQSMQNTLNTYVKTTGEPKGVLIQRAGSIKAYTSLNNNSLKSQIDSIDNQIERWQTKMSNQIDRYTTQFSRLEQLIAQMNSQSSAFAGLMGGSTGY